MNQLERVARAISRADNHADDSYWYNYRKEAQAAIDAMQQWQPIETAQKDGTHILVYCPNYESIPSLISVCAYHPDAGFCCCELREPTHWMPLPETPK